MARSSSADTKLIRSANSNSSTHNEKSQNSLAPSIGNLVAATTVVAVKLNGSRYLNDSFKVTDSRYLTGSFHITGSCHLTGSALNSASYLFTASG